MLSVLPYWYCWEASEYIAGMKAKGMVVIEYTPRALPSKGLGKYGPSASQCFWIVPGTADEMDV